MPKQPTLTPELLTAALAGLEAQRQQVESQIAEVRRMLGSRSPITSDGAVTTPGKRTMSAAAKRRVAEAQRKRWAAFHQQQGTAPRKLEKTAGKPATSAAQPRKRKLSAAGRRAIIEATKRRWQAFRAAQRKAG